VLLDAHIAGSGAIAGVARPVILCAPDFDDPSRGFASAVTIGRGCDKLFS
jgi:hypothetical protein